MRWRSRKIHSEEFSNSGLSSIIARRLFRLCPGLTAFSHNWPKCAEQRRFARPAFVLHVVVRAAQGVVLTLDREGVVCDILTETRAMLQICGHTQRAAHGQIARGCCYAAALRTGVACFCDDRVLSRLAWFSGLRLPVIAGSDLTAHLSARAWEQRLTISLIGPTAEACTMLGSRYPGLNVVFHTPHMGFIKSEHEVQKCVDFVVKTNFFDSRNAATRDSRGPNC
jgi:hypothetical protein